MPKDGIYYTIHAYSTRCSAKPNLPSEQPPPARHARGRHSGRSGAISNKLQYAFHIRLSQAVGLATCRLQIPETLSCCQNMYVRDLEVISHRQLSGSLGLTMTRGVDGRMPYMHVRTARSGSWAPLPHPQTPRGSSDAQLFDISLAQIGRAHV